MRAIDRTLKDKLRSMLSMFAALRHKSNTKAVVTQSGLYDELTNLPNRHYTQHLLTEILKNQHLQELSVLYLDIDRFKKINDSFGYDVGDLILKNVAEKMACYFNHNGIISRFGPDEFVFLLLQRQDKEAIKQMLQNLNTLFQSAIEVHEHTFYLNVHVGIASYPDNGRTANELIKNAETALNYAKERRQCYSFYTPAIQLKQYDELVIESQLREALPNNELELYFQPQYHSGRNEIIGLEALLRWNNPILGKVPPDKFIPIAEETGMIEEIGEWVLEQACMQLKEWHNQGFDKLKLSVNLSLRQLVRNEIVERVRTILNKTGIPPEALTLEITESLTMNYEQFIPIMKELRTLGLSLAIDDFGTGYSSLSYLKELPVNYLKIDRVFINDMLKNDTSLLIVRTIMSLSEHLNLRVIAEGVETKEQLSLLQEHRCNLLQGYLISKPLPSNEIEQMLFRLTPVSV